MPSTLPWEGVKVENLVALSLSYTHLPLPLLPDRRAHKSCSVCCARNDHCARLRKERGHTYHPPPHPPSSESPFAWAGRGAQKLHASRVTTVHTFIARHSTPQTTHHRKPVESLADVCVRVRCVFLVSLGNTEEKKTLRGKYKII